MTDPDIRELVTKGQTIAAIRRYRERHGGDLVAARAAIETIRWELTQQVGPRVSAFEAELDGLLRSGQKILAIKRYREQHGTSLQESLAAIEARLAALKS